MNEIDLIKLDYLILSCLVNSDESEQDIIHMAQRFLGMRFQCELPLNIQNPPSETKKRS